MDFKEATDRLTSAISHQDLADELGVNVQRVRQARLDPASTGYRPPPPGWEAAIVRLMERRHAADAAFVAQLRGTDTPPA